MIPRLSLPLLVLAACGPRTAPPEPPSGGRAEIRREVNNGEGYEFVIARDRSAVALDLPADADRAWPALMEAYARAGVALADVDTGRREMGNRSLVVRTRLGTEPLSAFLDCGRILGGPIANQYRIRLSVVSTLEPLATGETRLVTRVGASASDPASSSPPAACSSTGELEKRIAALTAVRLGAGR